MVDAQPTQETAVDPRPRGDNDAPLMGNPVLARTSGHRPRKPPSAGRGRAVGLPVVAAVVIIGAGAYYFFAHSSPNQPLMTNAPAAAPAASAPAGQPPAEASATSPTAVPAAPTMAAPPAGVAAPPRHEHVTRLAGAERTAAPTVRRTVVHHARAAEDESADVSATAPEVAPKPAAPSSPPVLSPPPAQP